MSNPETHSCGTCGYTWRHGQDGSHSCSEHLLAILERIQRQSGGFDPLSPMGVIHTIATEATKGRCHEPRKR